MESPQTPVNEDDRLLALRSLRLLQTPAEERFDRITRLAARLLGVPIAMVSLVSEDEQWFKSIQGLAASGTRRDVSFCGHAIFEEKSFVVEDALTDARFADNPLVVNDPKVRFYAGEPVRRNGLCVGTLCVIDRKPRKLSDADLETLKDLAALVEAEFDRAKLSETQNALIAERTELERKASIDGLTRLWNRGAIFDLLEREVARAIRGRALTIAMVDVDDFKAINDTYGHPIGDRVLAEVAARLRGSIRDADCLGRYGGEEFLVLLGDCGPEDAEVSVERLLSGISREPVRVDDFSIDITISIGFACFGGFNKDASRLIESADAALYRAKAEGKNRFIGAGPALDAGEAVRGVA